MVIRSRTTRGYRADRAKHEQSHDEPEEVVDEQELAFKELQAAKKRFQEAVYNKRHKTTNREELTTAGKTILKGAGRVVDDFFEGAGRISDSIERDIRKHSIQGRIDDTVIRTLMQKNKGGSSKPTSKRPKVWVEVRDAHGNPVLIDIKDIPAALRRKRR
jgi:hypothetical protein